MRAALRPVLVQVPCLAARVSPAACPWRLRSRPCVPSPAAGVPSLRRATILSAETSVGLLDAIYMERCAGRAGPIPRPMRRANRGPDPGPGCVALRKTSARCIR